MGGVAVDVVSAVEDACLADTAAAVREGGFVPPPQLHMLIDDFHHPYVGYVDTRPYYPGADAFEAISQLGDAAAAIMATRVALVWEAADLSVSLYGPGEYRNGLVVVVASLPGGHTLRWHPLELGLSGWDARLLPIVEPRWGEPCSMQDARLPAVMARVLARWRSLEGDPDTVFSDLVAEGFGVTLVQR